jgi:prolyl-tRNA synthetase
MAMEMTARSAALLKGGVRDIVSLENEPADGILRAAWCGRDSCGHELEDRLGVKMLGTLYEKAPFSGRCVVCEREAAEQAYLARTY